MSRRLACMVPEWDVLCASSTEEARKLPCHRMCRIEVEKEKSIRLSQARIGERERLKAEQELAAKKVRSCGRSPPPSSENGWLIRCRALYV